MSQSENKSQATTFTAPVVDKLLERIAALEAEAARLRRVEKAARVAFASWQTDSPGTIFAMGALQDALNDAREASEHQPKETT